MVKALDFWLKGCEFESWQEQWENFKFFSRVNFVCWLLFGVHSTHVLPQQHVKDPSHSTKSAGGRLHLNTHTPLTQRSWSGLSMLPSRHSVGTYQVTSSHTTHQGTFGNSHLSLLSYCGLTLAWRVELVYASESPLQKKTKVQAGKELSNILSKSLHMRKKPPPPPLPWTQWSTS